ncbi:MAG: PaaI family thioesterase [Pseudomonadales bacterium]
MDAQQLEKIYELFSSGVGAHSDMSLRFISSGVRDVVLELPFQEKHATTRANGALHPGALAAALDSACGFVVLLSLEQPQAIATVNLRIDHIHPAPAGKDVRIEARCYQQAGEFAYVNADVRSVDGEKMLCNALGIFKIGSPGPKLGKSFLSTEL